VVNLLWRFSERPTEEPSEGKPRVHQGEQAYSMKARLTSPRNQGGFEEVVTLIIIVIHLLGLALAGYLTAPDNGP
jgi:hypothetical protein